MNEQHSYKDLKGTLSGLQQYQAFESPLKMITLKPGFILKIFKFLLWHFGHVQKQLD